MLVILHAHFVVPVSVLGLLTGNRKHLRHCLSPSLRDILVTNYPKCWTRVMSAFLRDISKANRENARRLLQWLRVAVQPLGVEELAEVLAVDFEAARIGGIPKLMPD